MDTTPEQVLSIMGVTTDESTIIFTTKDLPLEGGDHNSASLYDYRLHRFQSVKGVG